MIELLSSDEIEAVLASFKNEQILKDHWDSAHEELRAGKSMEEVVQRLKDDPVLRAWFKLHNKPGGWESDRSAWLVSLRENLAWLRRDHYLGY